MNFKLYNNIKTFHADTYNILMRHEIQNVIPLGNIIMGNAGDDKRDWRDPVNWVMATVTDNSNIILTALMTPPFKITLYATDNKINEAAIHCLIDGLEAENITIPGVMTEKSLAETFAKIYTARKGLKSEIDVNLRQYELTQVNQEIKTGKVRLAEEKDMSFLPYWDEAFMQECFNKPMSIDSDIKKYRYTVDSKKTYLMEVDGTVVTMAKTTKEMQTVCNIAGVYTPPYFRGRGYASACVAAVSQIVLDKGFKKCILYTDLSNPTSNSIYMKIGYVPLGDSLEIIFNAAI